MAASAVVNFGAGSLESLRAASYLALMKRFLALISLLLAVSACTATYDQHGYAPAPALLDSVRLGVDRAQDVERKLGTPSDLGVESDTVWFYLSSEVENFAYRAPVVVERRLVAVRFNEAGIVQSIGVTGYQDGREVPLVIRTTRTFGDEIGFFEQLLGNLFNFGLAE
jgi:outer membrane protein assembly factor BamE (lipoprotein component of BamABCDE complex)